MTGYGKAEINLENANFTIEVKSLNSKQIDATVKMSSIYRDKEIDKISLIGFCFIIGGGIGNIYDRILYGSVTDFLFIDLGGIFKTGIFNIADLSVTTGMIMILLMSFRSK